MNKKRRRMMTYMLMVIYAYILLSSNVLGSDKNFMKVDVPSAVVIDANTGRVLYEQNAYEQRAMASLTKIMTSILLVENAKLDEMVTAPKEVDWIGGSVMGLKSGDKVTVHDLLAGMLLPSGNDAAYTSGIFVGSTVENFASMMTNKAKQIGAYSSSFKNPHGLDADGHYSTAYDLALIMRYSLKFKCIRDIINSETMTVKISGEEVTLKNTNALLRTYEYADGGKTGYTSNAERCLICTATKNNMKLIAVVLGATSTELRFNTTKDILEKCFDKYKEEDLSKYLNFSIQIPIIRGEEQYYNIDINENLKYPLSKEEIDRLYIKQDMVSIINAGERKGKYLGRIQLLIDDEVIFYKDYMLEKDIEKRTTKSFYKDILGSFV